MAQDAWAVFVLRPFSSLFQSIHHLKQIKSLGNKQARCYEVGKHRRRVSGIREQDERERSLSGDNAWRSNQDCSHIKALVMRQMNGRTKGGRIETAGLRRGERSDFLYNLRSSEAQFWTRMNR